MEERGEFATQCKANSKKGALKGIVGNAKERKRQTNNTKIDSFFFAEQRTAQRHKKKTRNRQQPLSEASPVSQAAVDHGQVTAVDGEDGDMSGECA